MEQLTPTEVARVSVETAADAVGAGKGVLIDVRERDEIAAIAAPEAKVYPMSELNPSTFAKDAGVGKHEPIYILCRSGGRSMRVAQALAQEGFSKLHNVEGGILAWSSAGLPVKHN